MNTGEAIIRMMESSNGEENLFDAISDVSHALRSVANGIAPTDAGPGTDETGGTVASLTESVMGITAGLCRVAEAISDLADAVRESK